MKLEFTAEMIANMVQGTVEGDPKTTVNDFAKIEEGRPGCISFLANPKYAHYLYETKSSIVLVNRDFQLEGKTEATLIRVDNAYETIAKLLSAYESMKRNLTTGRFFPIEVNYDNQNMTVKDAAGKDHRVITTEGLFNKICREYWFRSDGRIYQSSNVVMHLIDSPLLTQDEAKMTTWYEQVEDALKN